MSRVTSMAMFLSSLLLVGSGCVGAEVSSLSPENAAAELVLTSGSQIVIQPTILGVGGRIIGWLGADEEERHITLREWVSGETVSLDWSITTEVETAQSVAAREAHETQYATSPVGTEIPEEPEPEYEERVVSGSILSQSLALADQLGLPESWPEGEGGVSTSSLIWLSSWHYDELVNTRSTIVSLGLFDESLLRIEGATSQLTSMVDKLSGLLDPILGEQQSPSEESSQDSESLLTLEADPSWGEYTLLVDGIQTKVRVVKAKNAFANYVILANAQNPLILEIQLTPLSRGNLELLSSDGFAEGFGGYEIIQVNKKTGE